MERYTFSGDLSLKRMLVEMDLREPEHFEGRFDWLLDFRDAKLTATPEEIRQLGASIKLYRQEHPVKELHKIAAIAEDDVTFGLFRIFMVYADNYSSQMYISRLEEDALEWLKSDGSAGSDEQEFRRV